MSSELSQSSSSEFNYYIIGRQVVEGLGLVHTDDVQEGRNLGLGLVIKFGGSRNG